MDIELEWKIKLASYPKSHIFFTRDSSYLISEQFPDIWSDIELDREDLLVLPAYIEFLDKYVSRTADSIKDALDSFDYFMARIRAIEMELLNLKVREACLQYLGKHYFLRARDIDWMYANMMRLSTDNEFKEDLKSWYDAKKRMESGMPSPDFVLYDKDSNLVKLSDFRGQYVYIDIWATWCGPCIREIPDFKVLQAEFDSANIVFISIAFNDYYERWLSMIESEGLAGLHLLAPKTKHAFFQIYMVSGIPRALLIDPPRNIVEADSKCPRYNKLSPEITEIVGISQ
jgi:thiol-disulfide isomerase/thioredoxin